MSCLKQFRDFLVKIERETNSDSIVYLKDGQLIIRQKWLVQDEEYGLEQIFSDYSSSVSDEQIVDTFIAGINFHKLASKKLSKNSP